MTAFVELCCGSAALTLFAVGEHEPPCGYMGGKRVYARATAATIGLRRPTHITLCDAGCWGGFWAAMFGPEGDRIARMLDDFRHHLDRSRDDADAEETFFAWLASTPPPHDPADWAARFLILQAASAHQKPVSVVGGRWRTSGFARLHAAARRRGWHHRIRPELLAARVRAIRALPWPPVDVVHGDLALVEPIPNSIVYIDPNYAGRTGYAHSVERSRLLSIAQRHAAAGARVAVSEAEPLAIDGWHSVELQPDGGRPRRWGATPEFLTMNCPPMWHPLKQGALFA